MHVFITGGTGLIGTALLAKLLAQGHHVTALTRSPKRALKRFQHLLNTPGVGSKIQCISSLEYLAHLNNYDAVINLAGEPIAQGRWSARQKNKLETSRWQITEQLTDLIKRSASPPNVFVSGSAIGYYGRYGNEPAPQLTEDSAVGNQDYSHKLCAKWEEHARQAKSKHTRVIVLRTGIVLAKKGGALQKLLPQFQLGLGGKIGDGKHYMSWIHIDDMVGAILYLLDNCQCDGTYNLTAPEPVTNAEFAQTFAQVLRRPALLSTPSLMLKLAFGEMADILIYGHNVLPKALLESGYVFQHATLESGLNHLFNTTPKKHT